jgi:hypothetical protein
MEPLFRALSFQHDSIGWREQFEPIAQPAGFGVSILRSQRISREGIDDIVVSAPGIRGASLYNPARVDVGESTLRFGASAIHRIDPLRAVRADVVVAAAYGATGGD